MTELIDHRVPWSECPHCGAIADAAHETSGGRPPKEGDCSICIECGGLSTFLANLARRRPTPAEYEEFLADPDTAAAIAAWAVADMRRRDG